MLSEQDLSGLLEALYDAASDERLWGVFLERLAKTSRAHAADLVMHDMTCELHSLSATSGMDPDSVSLYNQHYHRLDPWASVGCSKPTHWTGISEELMNTTELVQGEFYNDFLLPKLGVKYAAFGVVEKGSRIASLGVFRSPTGPAFCPEDLKLVQLLVPHLKRAFQIHAELSRLDKLGSTFQTALNMVSTPIILLGQKGEIVFANRASADILSANSGLLATRDGLRAEHPVESAQLRGRIGEALATSLGKGCKPGGTQAISRKAGPPLQVVIAPMRNVALDNAVVCAIVIVTDPAQRCRPAYELLVNLFRMTPAECRIALLLSDGHSPSEICEMLSVTRNTFKSHLSSIYAKTSTSRQSQLVRLLMQLSAVR